MCQVFWTVGDVLGAPPSRGGGGDFIADAATLPPLPHSPAVRPAPGVYVRGIWVRAPKLDGWVMSFFGQRLEVSGRDRSYSFLFLHRRLSDLRKRPEIEESRIK